MNDASGIRIVLTFDISRGLEADLLTRMAEIVEDAGVMTPYFLHATQQISL